MYVFTSIDPHSTEISTLSLHDALPISYLAISLNNLSRLLCDQGRLEEALPFARECLSIREKTVPDDWQTFNTRSHLDRKSTRLNSSHRCISYAVFCLKKKIYI